MRILALMTFDIFRKSLGAAFESIGHEVYYLGDFDAKQLANSIQQFKPDMVVDMGWDVWHQDKHVDGQLPGIAKVIQQAKLFHLYFAEEDWLHFTRWSKRYCEIMQPSFVLTRSPQCIPAYREMGINASYFDVGCNPSFHSPQPLHPGYACDVAVVANGNFTQGDIRYKSIFDLVIPLFDQPYQVKIWGRDWEHIDWCYPGKKAPPHFLQGKLPFTETPKVYSSAKVCISIQSCDDQLSNRTMDILSSGGFLLTSRTKAVREKLRPGMNCQASSSPAETVELVRSYLTNEKERATIAQNGRTYAVEQFSYVKTLQSVWPEIVWEWERKKQSPEKISLTNRLLDANFTNQPAASWTMHNAQPTDLIRYHGAHTVRFEPGEANAYIQQSFPVQPGKHYLVRMKLAQIGKGMGAPVNLLVYYYDAANQLIQTGLYGSMFSTDFPDISSNQWFSYRAITTEAPATAKHALLLINKIGLKDSLPLVVAGCECIEYEV